MFSQRTGTYRAILPLVPSGIDVTGTLDWYLIRITDLIKKLSQVVQILKYIRSRLSCLCGYQFYQSIVWTMEFATNANCEKLAALVQSVG